MKNSGFWFNLGALLLGIILVFAVSLSFEVARAWIWARLFSAGMGAG